MTRKLLFFCGICAWAQSGIEVPAIGAIVDSSGALRQVQGVAGSFVLGPANMSGVLSSACAEQLCLVKTDSTIVSATGETSAPPGPAIFGLSRDEAIVFFPEPRLFARWRNDVLQPLDWTVDGDVLSVRLKEIAVRRDGEVSIVHPDGSVVDSIADATGPVLLLPEAIVFATSKELVLRRRDGTEARFELAGAESIASIGSLYVAIHVGSTIYALCIDPRRESLFLLPGTAP